MAREQAAPVAGTAAPMPARDEEPEAPAQPAVARVALRLAGHVVLAGALLVGGAVPNWRDDGLTLWSVLLTLAVASQAHAAWLTYVELCALRSESGSDPERAA